MVVAAWTPTGAAWPQHCTPFRLNQFDLEMYNLIRTTGAAASVPPLRAAFRVPAASSSTSRISTISVVADTAPAVYAAFDFDQSGAPYIYFAPFCHRRLHCQSPHHIAVLPTCRPSMLRGNWHAFRLVPHLSGCSEPPLCVMCPHGARVFLPLERAFER